MQDLFDVGTADKSPVYCKKHSETLPSKREAKTPEDRIITTKLAWAARGLKFIVVMLGELASVVGIDKELDLSHKNEMLSASDAEGCQMVSTGGTADRLSGGSSGEGSGGRKVTSSSAALRTSTRVKPTYASSKKAHACKDTKTAALRAYDVALRRAHFLRGGPLLSGAFRGAISTLKMPERKEILRRFGAGQGEGDDISEEAVVEQLQILVSSAIQIVRAIGSMYMSKGMCIYNDEDVQTADEDVQSEE